MACAALRACRVDSDPAPPAANALSIGTISPPRKIHTADRAAVLPALGVALPLLERDHRGKPVAMAVQAELELRLQSGEALGGRNLPAQRPQQRRLPRLLPTADDDVLLGTHGRT